MRTSVILIIASILALPACVTITEPVMVGTDTYMIGLGARGGFTTDSELLSQTIRQAGAFCQFRQRRIEVLSTNMSGTQGWSPQNNQVMFKCLIQAK